MSERDEEYDIAVEAFRMVPDGYTHGAAIRVVSERRLRAELARLREENQALLADLPAVVQLLAEWARLVQGEWGIDAVSFDEWRLIERLQAALGGPAAPDEGDGGT